MSGIFLTTIGNWIAATAPPPATLYELWTWGKNTGGQLGLGNTTNYSSPKQIGALATWKTLPNRTYQFGSATDTANKLWVWGVNGSRELGLGDTANRSSPVQVGSSTWSALGGGPSVESNAGIQTNGTLWGWGRNYGGQLGLGDTSFRSSPVQVGSLTNWNSTSFGGSFQAAIKTNGTLWTWGVNANARLGQNNTIYTSSPVQLGSGTTWSKAFTGGPFAAAITTDGSLWMWGDGQQGQLGQGNRTEFSSPVQVGALTWTSAIVDGMSVTAVRANGTLWSWGRNTNGSQGLNGVGYGNPYNRIYSPVQVGVLTSWSFVTGAYNSRLAFKTNGTLWTWGNNNNGELGLGDTVNRSSPVQVGSLSTWTAVAGQRYAVFATKTPS